MKNELVKSKKKANFIQRLFRREEGMETIQAVMMLAIAAIVAATVIGIYKAFKDDTTTDIVPVIKESPDTSSPL